MDRVSQELALNRRRGPGRKLDGSVGRVDSFMGRVVPNPTLQHREFLLVELKRPSLKVGRKELDQLEDYVNAIVMQPDFVGTETYWNFYLVTTEYDEVVKERVTQQNRQVGLYIDKPNHKVWVKTWGELLRDCDSRLHFIQEKLQIGVSDDEIASRIEKLKASILKFGVDKPQVLEPTIATGNSLDGLFATVGEMR